MTATKYLGKQLLQLFVDRIERFLEACSTPIAVYGRNFHLYQRFQSPDSAFHTLHVFRLNRCGGHTWFRFKDGSDTAVAVRITGLEIHFQEYLRQHNDRGNVRE